LRQGLDEIVAAMGGSSLMGGLGPVALRAVLETAEMVGLADGAILFRQGDPGDAAYLVVSGAVEVVVESPLGEVHMATLGPHQMVGETAVFSDLPRTATVRARGETVLVRVERAHLAETIARHPSTAYGLIAAMGRRIHALNQPLALLTLAAHALERDDADNESLARVADASGDADPFARSFQKLVREMESKQARRQELAVSARLQQSILPRPLDLGPGWDMAAFMKPARYVGGDFYDWFATGAGRMALLVADVSGKGIPAALFMAVSRTLIRASVLAGGRIEDALSAVNAQLEAENDEAMFVTVFLAELDLAAGTLRYVNAGHCDGWLRRTDGTLVTLAATGPAVALRPKVQYRAETVALAPGELLFLSSDGVNEAFSRDDKLFGDERLGAVLGRERPGSAALAVGAVAEAVSEFAAGAEQSDDITCLALLRS
jgi:serine phosphatase RsbU (regulator of sigma subunit)